MFGLTILLNTKVTVAEISISNTAIKDILDKRKKLKQLQMEYLEILRIFLSMKKKKIIVSQ